MYHARDLIQASRGLVLVDTCLTSEGFWETMVFPADPNGMIASSIDLDGMRYDTEDQARQGHSEMIGKWRI